MLPSVGLSLNASKAESRLLAMIKFEFRESKGSRPCVFARRRLPSGFRRRTSPVEGSPSCGQASVYSGRPDPVVPRSSGVLPSREFDVGTLNRL